MKKILVLILGLLAFQNLTAQKKIAITIDDVPNTKNYLINDFQSTLLNKWDSLLIPVTIFVNENRIYITDYPEENIDLLSQWVKRDYTIIGNHSYRHMRYSEVGFDAFSSDIIKGESLTKKLTEQYSKTLKYFRFPYNDLGKDSLQHVQIETFLEENHYSIAPYTIESSDWVFNDIYEYYLKQNNIAEAKKIAKVYIDKTLEYIEYFDSIAYDQYGRGINHIYLCHDNALNDDYLDILINKIQAKGYSIISLEEALQDSIYNQTNHYFGTWGFSWIYRWMTDKNERKKLMQQEPAFMDIYQLYQSLKPKD